MVLDAVTNKIIYRSALRPRTPKDPNKRLVDAGGEEDHQPHENPTKHVGSHQVPFPMCTLETLQKYCSTGSLLLTFC